MKLLTVTTTIGDVMPIPEIEIGGMRALTKC
jgi:hypothetical protein